jgi:hypothetical protein
LLFLFLAGFLFRCLAGVTGFDRFGLEESLFRNDGHFFLGRFTALRHIFAAL